jgi:hypothetical protein
MTNATAPAPAAPASSDTPIVSDLGRFVRVLFSPGAVFTEIQDRPTFWGPFAIASVITIIVNYFQRPFQRRIGELMAQHAGRTLPPDTTAKMVLGMVFTPVGILILCAISALILYALVSAMGGETTFKKMLTVVIFTFPIILITQIITAIVLHARGVESINSMSDMMVSLGADLLLPADANTGNFLKIFLAGIGPLQIWGVTIAAVGAMILGKLAKGSAWAAATIHYLIMLTALAALGAFGMKMAGG